MPAVLEGQGLCAVDEKRKVTEARKGLAPQSSAERTSKLRAGLKDKGVKRWELSPPPHPDDRPAIKEFAEYLARKRAKQKAG